jgi:broad specificity phosphatase PhoE
MAPTIHCIRHGQGLHNLHSDYTLPDPSLTPLGEGQCANLQSTYFPSDKQSKISLVAASPLKRALHTAWLVFEPLLTPSLSSQPDRETARKRMEILALPNAQETSSDPCDVGTGLPILSSFLYSQHPPWPVNVSLLAQDPSWNKKSFHSRYSPHSDAIKARARATRLFLRDTIAEIMAKEDRDDVQVVLVSHGGFLHYFSEDWESAATRPGTGFANCEVRSYQFTSPLTDDPDAKVSETTSSRKARGLLHPVAGLAEQEKLFAEAMEGWEAQGLERPDRLEDPACVPTPSEPRQADTAKTETEKV